ncbi:MAG TPA: 2TM domain-containing protein [Mycobacterium sp.]|nr:2TM domain-containing protein [Mycobacterium sp.]
MTDAFDRAVERIDADARRRRIDATHRQLCQMNRQAFRIHAAAFVAVQVLLFAVWLLVWLAAGGTAHPWFLYPLLGWGIGLAVHYATIQRR